MQLKVSVTSDRPDEYVGKKGLVKNQVITCQDVDPSGFRLLMPFDYTLSEDEKAKFADYKADAIEAENTEHNMGVLEAVRAYPMAATWALVMSSTIVSRQAARPTDVALLPPACLHFSAFSGLFRSRRESQLTRM